MPGWVVPGPFGSLISVGLAARVDLGELVAEGDAEVRAVGGGVVCCGDPLVVVVAERGNVGAAR
jgi:hypothetical protein